MCDSVRLLFFFFFLNIDNGTNARQRDRVTVCTNARAGPSREP